MKIPLLMIVAVLLVACASSDEQEERDEETAIADFIEINELESVGAIRTRELHSSVLLSDEHVIVSAKEEDFLIEYFTRCLPRLDGRVKPDVRSGSRAIYAKTDTYRGCRIKAIYALEAGQADELRQLGRSVGGQ